MFKLSSINASILLYKKYINDSIRTLLQIFYSSTVPTKIVIDGADVPLTDSRTRGLLHFNPDYRQLYVNVENDLKRNGEGPGGNFIPVGVSRLEETLTAANNNIGNYQLGELAMVVTGSSAGLYYKSSNSATAFTALNTSGTQKTSVDFATDSITTAKIRNSAVTNAKITAGITYDRFTSALTSTDALSTGTTTNRFITPGNLDYWWEQQDKSISDNAITLDKHEHGLSGQVLGYNASGVPVRKLLQMSDVSGLEVGTYDDRYRPKLTYAVTNIILVTFSYLTNIDTNSVGIQNSQNNNFPPDNYMWPSGSTNNVIFLTTIPNTFVISIGFSLSFYYRIFWERNGNTEYGLPFRPVDHRTN